MDIFDQYSMDIASSIENCSTEQIANIVLNDCQINDLKAKYQGKNQQWTVNTTNLTIVSRMDRKW